MGVRTGSALVCGFAALWSSLAAAACDVAAHRADPGVDLALEARLSLHFECLEGSADGAACAYFMSEGLRAAWGVTDLIFPGAGASFGRPMIGIEAARWLQTYGETGGWRRVGMADDPATHAEAAALAGAGAAVVAVTIDPADGLSTTAIVLPGAPQRSASYGFEVARIAQAGLYDGHEGFVGCPLSYGFRAEAAPRTVIYARRAR